MAFQDADRIADAVLRAAGGSRVHLRLPAPATANDDAEQLGLATPEFQDAPLFPVAFRKTDAASPVLLVAADVLAIMAGAFSLASVEALLKGAAGVLIGETIYSITSVRISQAGGKAYCYCLTLRAPQG